MNLSFKVIDKRTGKEPIFDHNHIFKEKWFKESGLIWCDIDGWYVSEDGELALIDDCGRSFLVDRNRFEVVYENIEQIKEEMCDHYCKMPEFYLSQYKDPDEAHEVMVNECCAKCPLERLNK